MSPKPNTAAIIPTDDGRFAVVVDGEIVRSGFISRGHGAMWATRQGLYTGKTPRRPKINIPTELEDHRILKRTVAAKLVGEGYPRFLAESNAGLWGPRYQLGARGLGHAFGDLKRGMAARAVK
jgi:hypothetical protein